MKSLILVIVLITCMTLAGCAAKAVDLINQIPEIEASSISSTLGGGTAATVIVTATGMRKEDGLFKVELLDIYQTLGPFFNFRLIIKDYQRKLLDEVEPEIIVPIE